MGITMVGPLRTVGPSRAAALAGMGIAAGLAIPLGGPRLVVVTAVSLAAVGALVYAPGVLFALYLLIPFYKGAVQPYSPVDITLILAGLNTITVIPLIMRRRLPRVSRDGVLLWTGLALLVLAGVLWAPDQVLALDDAGTFWLLVFVPLFTGALRVGSDPRHLRQLLWTFFAIGVVTTVIGVPSISGSDRLIVLGADTINVAAAALLVPLLGWAFVMHRVSWPVRVLVLVLVPAALLVALASGSRGPVLVLGALALMAGVRYLAHPRTVNWRRTGAVAVVGLAAIAVLLVGSTDLPAVSTSRFALFGDFLASAVAGDTDTSVGDTSSTARLALYGAALVMFQTQPILGFGTSGFEAMSNHLLGYEEAYPHNAVLQFAAEYGLFGLALFLALVRAGLIRRVGGPAGVLRLLFAYFLLQAMLSNDIFSDRATWGLLLLLLLAEAPGLVAPGPARDQPTVATADGQATAPRSLPSHA